MGGRGSSSVSAQSQMTLMSVAPREMSDEQLNSAVSQIQTEMESVSNDMDRLAPYALPRNPSNDVPNREELRSEYYVQQKRYGELRQRLSDLQGEQIRRNPSRTPAPRKSINSFGEATDRNITSASYERWQRRNSSRIESLIGGPDRRYNR